ncbi:PEP/pyruvate-binding domain-containing protein [Sorangium sp. So ce260]|uniref:PEP/pyruvate-binding domain-containing protein n=1 Tax=Sorangium sp. So ce260 TaxID=3133291 RepID=UPI003F62C468
MKRTTASTSEEAAGRAAGRRGQDAANERGVVRFLRDIDAGDGPQVGMKALRLAELTRAGFEVPDGFVVTTDALDALSRTGEGAKGSAAPIPADVASAVRGALPALGGDPLAVRSSGVVEDGEVASFAGQYETVLGVQGADEVLAALERCRASAFDAHVQRYGAERKQEAVARLAVLVQRLVTPDAAGVAFTANPVTGARDEVVVNAVKGLADRLVSGRSSPDEWVVRGGVATCVAEREGSLRPEQARAVAELARRVEQHYRRPQDIEWAIVGDRIVLLQARPITALPEHIPLVPVSATPPPGFWTRNAAYFPEPLSPMVRSFFLPALTAAYRRFFKECGGLAEAMESREIGGWVYMRVVPLGGRDLPTPPRWMFPILFRIIPQLRRRIRDSVEAIRTDRFGGYIERWYAAWRPSLAARIAAYQALDRTALSDAELAAHVRETARFIDEALETHFLMIGAHFFALAELAFACRDLLGWEESRVLVLLSGLSDKSTEPAQRLAELAARAREIPRLQELIRSNPGAVAEILAVDPAFTAALEEYQREYGCRALRYEVSEPTLGETPALTLRLVRDQLTVGYDGAAAKAALADERARVVAGAEQALAGRPAESRERFGRLVSRAQRAYSVREDNEFYTLSAPLAVMRYAIIELGRRLAARGDIAARDDVFFLELAESLAAFERGGDQRELVRTRRGQRLWTKAHPGPVTYGKDPGLPAAVDGLPPEARFVFEAGIWMREQGFAPAKSERKQTKGAPLDGIGVSAGSYTGPVRVVRDESEFGKIRAGDVLVCPITSPVWSVLFPSLGALVTDTGGMLSHSAIIAREYRIPAVVATGNATQLLHDDEIVTVDGDAGVVRSTPASP